MDVHDVRPASATSSYYERIDDDGDPNDLFQRNFLGQAGDDLFWENDVVDGGFLELVRLGVKPADDPKVAAVAAGGRRRAEGDDPRRGHVLPLQPRRLRRER